MKHSFLIFVLLACFALTSCNGSDSKQANAPSSKPSIEEMTTDNDSANPVSLPNQATQPKVIDPAKSEINNPKPAKAETETDRLLKSLNETFINMAVASKEGKQVDTEMSKKFIEIKNKLDEMEKNGQLDNTQKQLLKATNDAYDKYMKK